MKNLSLAIGLVIAFVTSSAYAIPTLFFDGTVTFDAISGELLVTSELVGTTDIVPSPNLTNSNLTFSANLESVDSSSPYYTIGLFSGVAGDDLTVSDGDMNTLLAGEFLSLQMKGGNSFSSGLVTGIIDATGGDLQTEFGTGNLIALELNLTTSFGADMFGSNFSGDIDGRIEGHASVPEPAMVMLLGFGLALLGMIKLPANARNTSI
jgi:hypothetical protein